MQGKESAIRFPVILGLGLMCVSCAVSLGAEGDRAESRLEARAILDETGVQGGLVVHVNCGDGRLTAALRAGDGYLVQGLAGDDKNVAAAREHVRSLGLYGPVTVEPWAGGRLPYADRLVNLIVAERLENVPRDEVMRVLVPGGVSCVKRDGRWTTAVKPWPEEIDQWTHYLHDAGGNAVADDVRVGVPRHVQWVALPLWPRGHDYTPSTAALVSAAGRIFYLQDEGIPGTSDARFDRWTLCARDAFNGVLLWKRPLPAWGGGEWDNLTHWATPMSLPRRLVAVDDRVYVTLGYRAPVSVLDACSGEILRGHEETDGADEVVVSDDVLLVRRRKTIPDYPPGVRAWDVTVRREGPKAMTELPPASMGDETLLAIHAQTGRLLWKRPEKSIVTLSLAASGGKVCYHNFEDLVCLDLHRGTELWQAESKPWPDLVGTAGTLVMYRDMVLFNSSQGLVARSAATGDVLWRGPKIPRSAPRHPADLLVAGGLIWGGLLPEMPMGTVPTQQSEVPRWTGTAVQGLDPATGRVARSIDVGRLVSPGHHVRCYRSKATSRYLLWPKRGVEFVDIDHGSGHMRCDWSRGACSYGVMPANGLVYFPPHPCACYVGTILTGFNALASASTTRAASHAIDEADRLTKGPAYSKLPLPLGEGWGEGSAADAKQPSPGGFAAALSQREREIGGDWPTYRHDPARGGSTRRTVPVELGQSWLAELEGKLSSPVVADGKVFVASVDEHTVHCLDADTGRKLWSYTAGGRVDSPPTIHDHLVLFGCRDGTVYCLRASDGESVWRFRAAADERQVVAFGQLESPWPVHGSVLVQHGLVYFAAGRSSFLDGGIHLYALKPRSGEVVHRAHLDGPWPDTGREEGHPFAVEGAQSDILVANAQGDRLYMLQNVFDLSLRRQPTPPLNEEGEREAGLHLAATSGFLDDTWFHRTHWRYGRKWPGTPFSPDGPKSGQILVFDDSTTYAVRVFTRQRGHNPLFTPGEDQYLLCADDNDNETVRPKGYKTNRDRPPIWSVNIPIRARAIVLADRTLFLAGPPDVVPEDDPYAAIEGRMGARLQVVSAADGKTLAEHELPAPPVFDGMSAARGCLFVATIDGHVLCLGKAK